MIDILKKRIVFGMLLFLAVKVGFTKSLLFMQASYIITLLSKVLVSLMKLLLSQLLRRKA